MISKLCNGRYLALALTLAFLAGLAQLALPGARAQEQIGQLTVTGMVKVFSQTRAAQITQFHFCDPWYRFPLSIFIRRDDIIRVLSGKFIMPNRHGGRSMENTRYNGLAGKARRTRDLNRATRMYAQQMIEEYLYPEPATWRPERYIPIHGRSEFLASAAFLSEDQDTPTQRQLELPMIATGAARESASSDQTVERSTAVEVAEAPRRDSVIRPRKAPFQPMQRQKQKQSPFTPSGFLFGCALGSAAAAMVLLVVQLAVG